MPKPVSVGVAGIKEAEAVLKQFEHESRTSVFPQGVRRAANVVKAEAKRNAPIRGEWSTLKSKKQKAKDAQRPSLRDLMWVKLITYPNGTVLGIVGPRRPQGAHGHLVEFGHKGKFWSKEWGGKMVRPHPFLRPAADTTMGAQQSAMIGYLKSQLQKVRARG